MPAARELASIISQAALIGVQVEALESQSSAASISDTIGTNDRLHALLGHVKNLSGLVEQLAAQLGKGGS